MKKPYKRPLTPAELEAMPDEDIDYSDIPEATADFWKTAEIVEPAPKTTVSLRLPRDVVDYFKRDGAKGYTARIASVLSAYVKMRTEHPR